MLKGGLLKVNINLRNRLVRSLMMAESSPLKDEDDFVKRGRSRLSTVKMHSKQYP
jgi:hypothetical protein